MDDQSKKNALMLLQQYEEIAQLIRDMAESPKTPDSPEVRKLTSAEEIQQWETDLKELTHYAVRLKSYIENPQAKKDTSLSTSEQLTQFQTRIETLRQRLEPYERMVSSPVSFGIFSRS